MKSFWLNYVCMLACSLIPTWSLTSYFSRNLIFDGLLFDTTLVISSVIIFAFLGQAHGFNIINWIGVGLVIAGLVMARLS